MSSGSNFSRGFSEKLEGDGYFFLYQNDEQRVKFFDRCTTAEKVRGCEDVRKVVEKYHPTLGDRPFDEFATAYMKCLFPIVIKKEAVWIDLYGKREELKDKKYNGLQLRAIVTDITYEMPKTLSMNVDSLLVKTFTNAQNEDEISGEISEEITKTVETVKSSQHDWKLGLSVELGASDFFGFSSASFETSVEYSGSAGRDVTTSSSRTYSISDKITIPPNSTVRVMWTMLESNVKLSWTSKLQLSGMMTAMYNNVIFFFPVGDMALVYDEYFKRISNTALYLESGGDLYTSTALQSTAHINQFPLGRTPTCIS